MKVNQVTPVAVEPFLNRTFIERCESEGLLLESVFGAFL